MNSQAHKIDVLSIMQSLLLRTSSQAEYNALVRASDAVAALIVEVDRCLDTELGQMACAGSMAPCENALGRLLIARDRFVSEAKP